MRKNSLLAGGALAAAALLLGAPDLFGATPFDQAKTTFPSLDLARLKQGEIVGQRSPLGNFSRGVSAQSCYFIHAPVPAVEKKLLHWNAAAHPELEISVYHEYRWPAAGDAWNGIGLDPKRRDDRWLTERTSQLLLSSGAPTELHVSRDDITTFREMTNEPGGQGTGGRKAAINEFWRKVLRDRNDRLADGGLAALPTYISDGTRIDTRAEFAALIKSTPAVAAHFQALVEGAPFIPGSSGGLEIVPYWEATSVRGHTNLQQGFLVARKSGASVQVADCTYYVSDTFFLSLSLYELSPQDGGTLVWQTDFASAPFRAFTAGLDRVFAGNEMIKEAASTAKLFRADVESKR